MWRCLQVQRACTLGSTQCLSCMGQVMLWNAKLACTQAPSMPCTPSSGLQRVWIIFSDHPSGLLGDAQVKLWRSKLACSVLELDSSGRAVMHGDDMMASLYPPGVLSMRAGLHALACAWVMPGSPVHDVSGWPCYSLDFVLQAWFWASPPVTCTAYTCHSSCLFQRAPRVSRTSWRATCSSRGPWPQPPRKRACSK